MKRNTNNKTLKLTAAAGLAVSMLAFASCGDAQSNGNWQSLFDGETLTGWTPVGGEAPYEVVDGAIVGTMTAGTPNSFLITEQEYGDFILELEVKLEGETTNSGIQTRSRFIRTPMEVAARCKDGKLRLTLHPVPGQEASTTRPVADGYIRLI